MNPTQEKLLTAAAEAVARHGFDKANVNTIAAQAGFSIGTFYNYFPTKWDLMEALIHEISQKHVTAILEQVKTETNPERQMVLFFEAGFSFVQENLTQARAIFNTLNGPDEVFKALLFEAYQPLFGLLGEVLGQGIQAGVFYHPDPEVAVRLIMLIYLGVGGQVNPEGRHWLEPDTVSDFILSSLRCTS